MNKKQLPELIAVGALYGLIWLIFNTALKEEL
jgi:hypothetical protein